MAWAHNQNEILFLITGQNNFRRTAREVEQDLSGMERASRNLGDAIKTVATATLFGVGLTQIVEAGIEMTKLGASFMRVGDSYEELAQSMNTTGEELLASMRRVSNGTISDMELMRTANIASLLSVAVSAQQLTGLLQVAAARGRALGLSTQDAFERIATGIGRLSPKILDDLGILIGGQTAFAKYAQSVGKSLLELTDMEKRQFLVNRVLQEAKPLADDAASAFERMGASLTNLRSQLGTAMVLDITGSGIPDFVSQWMDNLTKAFSIRNEIVKTLQEVGVSEWQGDRALQGEGSEALIHLAWSLRTAREEVSAGTISWREYLDILKQAKEQYIAATPALQQQAAAAAEAASVMEVLAAATTQVQMAIQAAEPPLVAGSYVLMDLGNAAGVASDQLRGLAGAMAAVGGVSIGGQIDAARDKIRSIAEGLIPEVGLEGAMKLNEKWQKQADALGATLSTRFARNLVEGTTSVQDYAKVQDDAQWAVAGLTSSVQGEAEGIRDLNRELERASKKTSDYQKWVDELKSSIDSMISSVLSGTSSLVSFDPFDFVSNPDGPARDFGRMWDVAVNGFKSQWLDELRAQGLIPDDVIDQGEEALKRFAEAKARAFQKGTDLSLMDKGQLKQMVLDQIAAQEAMAALRNEILADILGTGVSKSKATTAIDAVLGGQMTGVGAAGATDYGAGFIGSMSGQGAKIAATLAVEIEANKGGFQGAGRAAGIIWGDEFLKIVGDNVPPELVLLLVSLVTPGVMERIAKDQKRTEPTK